MFVPPSDKESRHSILKIQIQDRPIDEKINFKTFADSTSGFPGADLKNLIDTTCELAIEDSIDQGKEIPLCNRHIRAAPKEVQPTTQEWLTTIRNYAKIFQ